MPQQKSQSNSDQYKMDSRKFLSALNESAQAKIALFEEHVKAMGKEASKNWKLAALHAKSIYIEDVDSHEYFVADHAKDQGRVVISNIRPLRITEGDKQSLFSESCLRLINALESNDQKAMNSAFSRMSAQRFSSRAVPYSGMVRCRDGVLRQIKIESSNNSLDESVRNKLIAAIVEGLKDRIIVENGEIVSGSFQDGDPVKLPLTKWATRKLVAKRMLEAAKNAYWSEGFQTRVYNAARLLAESKIAEAVNYLSPFLDDMEEFTLLTRKQTQQLVENALAAKAIFNDQLCDNTATLFHRTNLKVNKQKILDEWAAIAKKSEHAVLAENVAVLRDSKNFEAAYDKFLTLIFETISNRDVAAEALATTLQKLRDKTPKIKESHDLASKLNGLITRLKQPDFDDAAIYEAEDLIATIQEELAANESLSNFDQIPGDDQQIGDPLASDGVDAGGAPVININSPLIQIGGQSSATGEGEGTEPPMPPAPEEGDPELEALLGGQGQQQQTPAGGQPPMPPQGGAMGGGGGMGNVGLESKKSKKGITESRPVHYEMREEGDDDMPEDFDDEIAESNDPYAIKKSETISLGAKRLVADYGAPVIGEHDATRVVQIMQRLAVEHKLTPQAVKENMSRIAKASIEALGLRIPAAKMDRALEQVTSLFESEDNVPFKGAAPLFKKKGEKEEQPEDEGDDGDTAESQFKLPLIKKRGLGRSNYRPVEEGITWGKSQADAIAGTLNGVNFILDHGGESADLKPVILSEDGSIEIPIPEELFESAFASAKLTEGAPEEFESWLSESIEQLRPITPEEDQAIEEAMAKITTGPDGTISVEVTDDVSVGNAAEGGADLGTELGDDAGATDEMAPVDSLETDATAPEGDASLGAEEQMPDFEGDDAATASTETAQTEPVTEPSQTAPATGNAAQSKPPAKMKPVAAVGAEEEPSMFEDKDITSPPSAKYTKHVKDNKRAMPAHKLPSKTDDKLEELGPELKDDDGSGVNPPTAKKGTED